MRIGIDARLCGERHAGIGRYVKNLLVRLPFVLPQFEWVYFFYDRQAYEEVLVLVRQLTSSKKSEGDFKGRVKVVYVPIRHYTALEQVKLPRILKREKLDLLHVPHFNVPIFYRGKLCVTIFDLLWHEYKGARVTTLSPLQYRVKYLAYKLVTWIAVKKASLVFYSAEVVKKAILRYYPWAKNKLVLTRYGVTLPAGGAVDEAWEKRLPKGDYLLYVGSLYPHKNIRVVLEALTQDKNLHLVLAGSRDVFVAQVEALVAEWNLGKQVTFLGRVSDSELSYLYKNCQALVQPSLSEGFGLTGVEAMGLGAPVLASKIEIFREIYQDAYLAFEPSSAASFLQALGKLQRMSRALLITKGKKLAATYSWDEMVEIVAKSYAKILDK